MLHNDIGTHMNDLCVCAYVLKKNEVYFTLVVQCSTFLFEDTFLHNFVATFFFEALNHHSKTTNQIQEKHCFDMEYMSRQTKNLTITPLWQSPCQNPYTYPKKITKKIRS